MTNQIGYTGFGKIFIFSLFVCCFYRKSQALTLDKIQEGVFINNDKHSLKMQKSSKRSVLELNNIENNRAKSRKYQGIFEVKSRVKTWQVRGIWSQQLEH